mmetsp:Transcript_14177/g.19928  ORF Transcript_14177/g.19928 Transcript_14177/m.19928 type:complete len:222 (-) Transcript_14177:902-1567(-)
MPTPADLKKRIQELEKSISSDDDSFSGHLRSPSPDIADKTSEGKSVENHMVSGLRGEWPEIHHTNRKMKDETQEDFEKRQEEALNKRQHRTEKLKKKRKLNKLKKIEAGVTTYEIQDETVLENCRKALAANNRKKELTQDQMFDKMCELYFAAQQQDVDERNKARPKKSKKKKRLHTNLTMHSSRTTQELLQHAISTYTRNKAKEDKPPKQDATLHTTPQR